MATPKRLIVRVDAEKCQGHGRCKALAPALFQLDSYGNSQVILARIMPEDQIEKAHLAKPNCPEFAVEIIEE